MIIKRLREMTQLSAYQEITAWDSENDENFQSNNLLKILNHKIALPAIEMFSEDLKKCKITTKIVQDLPLVQLKGCTGHLKTRSLKINERQSFDGGLLGKSYDRSHTIMFQREGTINSSEKDRQYSEAKNDQSKQISPNKNVLNPTLGKSRRYKTNHKSSVSFGIGVTANMKIYKEYSPRLHSETSVIGKELKTQGNQIIAKKYSDLVLSQKGRKGISKLTNALEKELVSEKCQQQNRKAIQKHLQNPEKQRFHSTQKQARPKKRKQNKQRPESKLQCGKSNKTPTLYLRCFYQNHSILDKTAALKKLARNQHNQQKRSIKYLNPIFERQFNDEIIYEYCSKITDICQTQQFSRKDRLNEYDDFGLKKSEILLGRDRGGVSIANDF